jgi:hypothetical protein
MGMMSPENGISRYGILLYLFVFTQFRTESRLTLFLGLL